MSSFSHRHSHPSRNNSLHLESLENRCLLAGNVVAEVNEGVLEIQGDPKENWIEIRQVGDEEFIIIGLDSPLPGDAGLGAPTTVNGQVADTFSGVRDIKAKMAGEDDYIFFNGDTAFGATQEMVIKGRVDVFGNQGGDNILFENVTIRQETHIRGNDGGDTIQFIDCNLNKHAAIRGQGQGDTIGIFRTTFRSDGLILGGNGPDRVFVGLEQGGLEGGNFRKNVYVNGGRNRDFLEFTDTRVIGNATIVGGDQKDDVDINDSVFKSHVRIDSGSGPDIIEINDTRFPGAENRLRINGGDGIDKIRIFDSLFESQDFVIRGGSGNDTKSINDSTFAEEPEEISFLGGPGLLDILDVGVFGVSNGNVFPGGFAFAGWEELA